MVTDTAPLPLPTIARPRFARLRRDAFAYALIAPAALFMLVVHIAPTAAGVYVALLKLNLFTYSQLFRAPFVGLDNFVDILLNADNPVRPGLWNATRNTLLYTGYTLTATLVFGLAIALLLNREFTGRRLLRTLMLAPWVVPSFVVAILWQFMWQSEAGIVNKVLVDYTHVLGEKPVWLLGPNSLWAIVIPSIWRALPFVILVFIAGLQAIPRDLYEAAAIDGANAWQRFRYVTVPLLAPVLLVVAITMVIYVLKVFDIVLVIAPSGVQDEANVIALEMWQTAFGARNLGLGSAVAVLLFVLVVPIMALNIRRFRSSEGS